MYRLDACHRQMSAVPQKQILPSPRKFSENPFYDIPEPLNRAPILAAPRLKRLCSYQLADGQLRRRLETALAADGWEIDGSAVRFAITNGSNISGVRLVKGHHVRLR